MNHAVITGRLGSDPEMQYFESGKCKTSLRLAVARDYKKDGQPDCDWIPVEFWGKQAELIGEHVKKGHMLLVQGRMVFEDYTDKNGSKRTKTYLSASGFDFLERKDKAEAPAATPQQKVNKAKVNGLVDSLFASEEEIPF